jgi:class 3 adenylate cyclase/tetratricopeptide (TPR) repeat protein
MASQPRALPIVPAGRRVVERSESGASGVALRDNDLWVGWYTAPSAGRQASATSGFPPGWRVIPRDLLRTAPSDEPVSFSSGKANEARNLFRPSITELRHNAGRMDARSERRLVTCLFIDVVGSTDATVRLGPERMQRLLRDAFAEMSTTISQHGGTIETYVGDAIFALFGAPVAQADDAERALRAADACARWSSAPAAANARLTVRVGIETGEALVDLGGVDRHQRMAIGECVNIAARLQQQGEPGDIIIGPTCHEATKDVAQFEALGALSLKGLGEVEAWRFTEFGAGEGVQEVPFVGRDSELRILGDAFERAQAGTATLALVVGPPGQGKSRLSSEAIGTWNRVRLIQARCRPGSETGVNTPIRQLVNADLPDATPDAVRGRLTALLGEGDAIEVAAAVCHSAGLAVDERLLTSGRMEQRDMIADAWRQYLAAVAREATLAVWVEDVHWADPVLLRIIDQVTFDLEAPIVVVATARPEFVGSAHLRPSENRLQIDLAPLDTDAAEQLALAAGDGRTDADRAAGNPLFIIELARSRTTMGEMPVTIQAAIAARLDELSTSERELLQRASVAGETFDVRDAALLAEREPHEVAGALGRIAHLGFVAPVDSRYRFHHALVREVAYGRLPVAERMALHARYAAEGVDPADVEALAHHWWEAVNPFDAQWVWEDRAQLTTMRSRALAAHLAAGRRLEERNAYEESLDIYTRAIELADDPADKAAAEAAVGRAYTRQGSGDEAWEHRLRAIGLFSKAGQEAPAELYADMLEIATQNWGYFQHLPDDGEVLRLLGEGERIARASGDEVSLARLLTERASFTDDVAGADEIVHFVESAEAVSFADAAHRMGMLYLWNGKVDRALELYETVVERLIPAGGLLYEPEALLWYALAAFHVGEGERADGVAARLLEDAARRSPHTRQHAYALKTFVAFVRGDWHTVASTGEELAQLVDANPEAGFCLVGAAGVAYGAIPDILAGRSPDRLDELVARMVPDSTLVQASSVMVPHVMVGDRAALDEGLKAYGPGLRLWDRQRTWDVFDLMPAVALTMLERWDDLRPSLDRLDLFAEGGSRVAAATAAAIREEKAAADGGPAPTHDQLLELGGAGISQLLQFRPPSITA